MNYAESLRKCAEWKRKYKETKTKHLETERRLNAETDRADLAEHDKLRAQAELAVYRQVIEDRDKTILEA